MSMLSSVRTVRVSNVNGALSWLQCEAELIEKEWRDISPRGLRTLEHRGPVITEYVRPYERVLFNPVRDANPFFHFMESLWILNGQYDVETLAKYNSGMRNYSDDGLTFHGAYGYRLRHAFGKDQLLYVIDMMKKDPDTRRAVMMIWHPELDLGVNSKDLPCNDALMFKLRDGQLDMTVCNRSNDAIWGAYGANAVQFSMIQEFIAAALRVRVGVYRQVSDSFHIYTDLEVWKKLKNSAPLRDPYYTGEVGWLPIMLGTDYLDWLAELRLFMAEAPSKYHVPFFDRVARPIRAAWSVYKDTMTEQNRNSRITHALYLIETCAASDWRKACREWLERRRDYA